MLKWLFPDECLSCKAKISDIGLCTACYRCLEPIVLGCNLCGIAIGVEDSYCLACNKNPPYYSRLYTPFIYNKITHDIIHKLKYGDKDFLARYMAKIIASRFDFSHIDAIIAVPIARLRLWKRLYNQAELIAYYLSLETGKPYIYKALNKKSSLKNLTKLGRKARLREIKDTISIVKLQEIQNKILLLIDDVSTTGATSNECSKVLLIEGAKQVEVAAFAKTMLKY
jgi:ComF family protein